MQKHACKHTTIVVKTEYHNHNLVFDLEMRLEMKTWSYKVVVWRKSLMDTQLCEIEFQDLKVFSGWANRPLKPWDIKQLSYYLKGYFWIGCESLHSNTAIVLTNDMKVLFLYKYLTNPAARNDKND